MSRLIDVDKAIKLAEETDKLCGPIWNTGNVVNFLESVPLVDAVKVVRCRDCEYSYKCTGSSTGYRCKVWGVYDTDCDTHPNGYCYKGEGRENHG